MAKPTKMSASETGETGVTSTGKKTVSRKRGVRKVSVKSTETGKKASSEKGATKRQAVAKKTLARKSATKKKATTKKKAVPKRKASAGAVIHGRITQVERHEMIAETAYLRAESQGFLSDEREDWLRAEADVDSLLTRAGVIVTD